MGQLLVEAPAWAVAQARPDAFPEFPLVGGEEIVPSSSWTNQVGEPERREPVTDLSDKGEK